MAFGKIMDLEITAVATGIGLSGVLLAMILYK